MNRNKNTRERSLLIAITLLIAGFAIPSLLLAEDTKQATNIDKVMFTYDSGNSTPVEMDIVGHGFGNRVAPTVLIDGLQQTVTMFTDTHIAIAPAGISSGAYRLKVQNNSRQGNDGGSRMTQFYLTIGAAGTKGDPGPAGPQGAAGVQGAPGPQGLWSRDLPDLKDLLGQLALPEPPELLVPLDQLDLPDLRALWDFLARRELRDRKVCKALRDLRDQRGPMECLAPIPILLPQA